MNHQSESDLYPYKIKYLNTILLHGGVDGSVVGELNNNIRAWLLNNIHPSRYKWEESMIYRIPRELAFAHEEDLLVFKLRWNM